MTNSTIYQHELEQERFGLRVASRLSDSLDDLPYEISERLRAARVQAVAKRKIVATKMASNLVNLGGSSSLTLGSDQPSWWGKLATAAPLLMLVLGLITINLIQDDIHIKEIADLDAALLTDDLPPAAYTDPGFAHYLKISSGQY
jgi:uncharacterized membrane protein YhdT